MNEDCNITYILQYTIDDIPIKVNLMETSWIIPEKLEECSTIEAELWIMTKGGIISETSVSNNFTGELTIRKSQNDLG